MTKCAAMKSMLQCWSIFIFKVFSVEWSKQWHRPRNFQIEFCVVPQGYRQYIMPYEWLYLKLASWLNGRKNIVLVITEVWSSGKLGHNNGPVGSTWTKEAYIICYGNFHFKLKHANTQCDEQMDDRAHKRDGRTTEKGSVSAWLCWGRGTIKG